MNAEEIVLVEKPAVVLILSLLACKSSSPTQLKDNKCGESCCGLYFSFNLFAHTISPTAKKKNMEKKTYHESFAY